MQPIAHNRPRAYISHTWNKLHAAHHITASVPYGSYTKNYTQQNSSILAYVSQMEPITRSTQLPLSCFTDGTNCMQLVPAVEPHTVTTHNTVTTASVSYVLHTELHATQRMTDVSSMTLNKHDSTAEPNRFPLCNLWPPRFAQLPNHPILTELWRFVTPLFVRAPSNILHTRQVLVTTPVARSRVQTVGTSETHSPFIHNNQP